MQITLLIIGFCLIAYGGWKILVYLLLKDETAIHLQNRKQLFNVRPWDGGYSKIAKENKEASKDEVVNQRGAGPISGETS